MVPTNARTEPTLDQKRARHAWDAVLRAESQAGVHEKQSPKKFGGQAKKLPVRIIASGLGQSLAFLKAKDYAPGLVVELNAWVAQRMPTRGNEPSDLLERVIKGDSDFLRRATDEVLAYLSWLNRFAEAKGLTEGDQE
jgi:CRISPR-associated protein Cmr5